MRFFFVGLAMRNCAHDYAGVHAALFSIQARRVSVRIWLCVIEERSIGDVLADIGGGLSREDEMLVVEVPDRMRGPRLVSVAA